MFNAELGGFGVSGANVVFVVEPRDGDATAVAFTDADLQSGNVILTVPTLALGITDDTTIDFEVAAFDNYFTGDADRCVRHDDLHAIDAEVHRDQPARRRRRAAFVGAIGTAAVPGGDEASPSQIGCC